MTWRNKSRPSENPKNVVVAPPPDPPPDLATKPADKVGYCFGYVCPEKHVNFPFENLTVDGLKERRACQTCGSAAKPASVRKICEAQWINHDRSSSYFLPPEPDWRWRHNYFVPGYSLANWLPKWTRYEFVHFLDEPKPVKKHKSEAEYETWLTEVEKHLRRPLYRTEMCLAAGLYTQPATAKEAAETIRELRRKK